MLEDQSQHTKDSNTTFINLRKKYDSHAIAFTIFTVLSTIGGFYSKPYFVLDTVLISIFTASLLCALICLYESYSINKKIEKNDQLGDLSS